MLLSYGAWAKEPPQRRAEILQQARLRTPPDALATFKGLIPRSLHPSFSLETALFGEKDRREWDIRQVQLATCDTFFGSQLGSQVKLQGGQMLSAFVAEGAISGRVKSRGSWFSGTNLYEWGLSNLPQNNEKTNKPEVPCSQLAINPEIRPSVLYMVLGRPQKTQLFFPVHLR